MASRWSKWTSKPINPSRLCRSPCVAGGFLFFPAALWAVSFFRGTPSVPPPSGGGPDAPGGLRPPGPPATPSPRLILVCPGFCGGVLPGSCGKRPRSGSAPCAPLSAPAQPGRWFSRGGRVRQSLTRPPRENRRDKGVLQKATSAARPFCKRIKRKTVE